MGTRTRGFANLITASGPSALPAGLVVNAPYFRVTQSADQLVTTYVTTKIQFNIVTFDSASGFDNTTNYRYTIPSGQGGYWFIQLTMNNFFPSNNGGAFNAEIRKNGSAVQASNNVTVDSGTSIARHNNKNVNAVLNLTAGDYLEGWGMLVGTTPYFQFCTFQGFRLVQ